MEAIIPVTQLAWSVCAEHVLDIGPGRGTYGCILRNFLEPPLTIDAVEAEPRYITERLVTLYDEVTPGDIRTKPESFFTPYDTVLLLDVIEHMTKLEGLELLMRISGHVIITTPANFFQNPEADSDDHYETERHQSLWTVEDFAETGRLHADWSDRLPGGILVLLGPRTLHGQIDELGRWWDNEARRGHARERISPALGDAYDETGGTSAAHFTSALRRFLPETDFSTLQLLEFGCGEGRVTQHLVNQFSHVYAADISEAMLLLLQQRDLPNVTPLAAPGGGLPSLPDSSIDIAVSDSVFLHNQSRDIRMIIFEIRRVLGEGGLFLFQQPCYEQGRHEPNNPIDVGIMSPKQIRYLAQVCGYEVLELAVNPGAFSFESIGDRHADFHVFRAI